MVSQQNLLRISNEENGRNWKKPVDLNNVQGRGIIDGKYKLKVHNMRRDSRKII